MYIYYLKRPIVEIKTCSLNMSIRIGCFRYDFNPLYCTATFFGHQLHTYVPLIDLVQLEAFMDSCDITDKVWIIKKVPSLGDHTQFNSSINF